MLNNWSNTQKALAATGIVLLILLIMNWSSVWAWVQSLGGSEERSAVSEQPVTQQVIQNVIVTPRPVQGTCDQLNQEISHFTSLLAQYPTSVQIKNRLDQLKQQYVAKNCNGGPKPNPNAAV